MCRNIKYIEPNFIFNEFLTKSFNLNSIILDSVTDICISLSCSNNFLLSSKLLSVLHF